MIRIFALIFQLWSFVPWINSERTVQPQKTEYAAHYDLFNIPGLQFFSRIMHPFPSSTLFRLSIISNLGTRYNKPALRICSTPQGKTLWLRETRWAFKKRWYLRNLAINKECATVGKKHFLVFISTSSCCKATRPVGPGINLKHRLHIWH